MTARPAPEAMALFRRAAHKRSAANVIKQDRAYWLRWAHAAVTIERFKARLPPHAHEETQAALAWVKAKENENHHSGIAGEHRMKENAFTIDELEVLIDALTVHGGLVAGLGAETEQTFVARTSAGEKVLALYEEAANADATDDEGAQSDE